MKHDPYDALAMLLWLLQPDDVAYVAGVANELVEQRLMEFLSGQCFGEPPPDV